jgi:sulfotransferase
MRMHFISGLPRSGSTLLSAVLRQNPRFTASIISPVGKIFNAIMEACSQANEAAVFVADGQRECLLRACFDAYYGNAPFDVVFDTNRQWTTKIAALAALFPQCRIICCVRNPAAILDSFERLFQRNCWEPSGIFNFDPGGTVYERIEAMTKPGGVFGFAYGALRQAIYGEHANRLIILPYEYFVAHPGAAMQSLHTCLQERADAPYDFENIKPIPGTTEFDARLGTPGLHDLLSRIEPPAERMILPPDIIARYEWNDFWRRQLPTNVTVIGAKNGRQERSREGS